MLKKSLSLTTSDLGFPLSLQNVLGLIILIFIEKQRLNTFSSPPAPVTVLLLQCCCYSVVAYIIAVAVLYCVASFVLVGITF